MPFMKITSINLIDESAVPLYNPRNTQRAKDVQTILENLKRAPEGKALVIAGSDLKKFERYALQTGLQKQGAHAIVSFGKHNNADALFVRKLDNVAWKKYLDNKKDSK